MPGLELVILTRRNLDLSRRNPDLSRESSFLSREEGELHVRHPEGDAGYCVTPDMGFGMSRSPLTFPGVGVPRVAHAVPNRGARRAGLPAPS